MKKIIFFTITLFFCVSAEAGVLFSDDFESGNLDKWIVDGRQQGMGYAEVVTKYESQMAHLHHEGLTEITLEKVFDYSPCLTFNFDMEAKVSSPYGPTSDHYSAAGAMFDFLDKDSNILARAVIARSSSSHLFTHYNPLPNWEVFEIPDDLLHSYTVNASDIITYFDIDEDLIAYLNFRLWAYGSGTQKSLIADVWADNVNVEVVYIDASIFIMPRTLNLNSGGKWIIASIGLPEDYNVNQINVDSITINAQVPADSNFYQIIAPDNDGINKLMVRFDRAAIESILQTTGHVELAVNGELMDGTLFRGIDTIRVVNRNKPN